MATWNSQTGGTEPEDDQVSVSSQDTSLTVANKSDHGGRKRKSFLDAKTLEPTQRRFGPQVNASLVQQLTADSTSDSDHLSRIISWINGAEEVRRRSDINFVPQVLMLPDIEQQKNMALMADMLHKNNEGARRRACSVLEKLLVEIQTSEAVGLTESLMKAVKATWETFNRQSESSRFLHEHACLHLMAAAAVLSRCPPPSFEQYSSAVPIADSAQRRSRGGVHTGGNLKELLLEALHLFNKTVKEQLQCTPLPCWAEVDWFLKGCTERKRHFERASFCQLVVYTFTLLNEVVNEEWSDLGQTLLGALRDLYETVQRSGRHRHSSQAVRVTISFLMVRGLVLLLRNKFETDITEVGERKCIHVEIITDLILEVVTRTSDDCLRRKLIQDVCDLPFHNALIVRQKFGCCLRTEGPSLFRLALGYLENNLQVISFRQNPTDVSESKVRRSSRDEFEACGWFPIKATVCQKPAEGAVYVPKASCMAKSYDDLLTCIDKHPGSTEDSPHDKRLQIIAEAKRHRNNLDMLKYLLHPEGKHVVKLLAYQIKPFPVYVAESVMDRRLIGYLVNHRKEGLWLESSVLVRICRDFLDALLYLLSRDVINCDTTTYNMIVEDGTESRRWSRGHAPQVFPSQKFAIKFADLGLAYRLASSQSTIQLERDQGPIPVRWTAPEALFEGRHSEQSMVYSSGCVMYELWTHGCQPFTKYDKELTTAEILTKHKMACEGEGSVLLYQWPCIPDDVYNLIKRCTSINPQDRPSLREVREEVENLSCLDDESDGEEEPELNATLRKRELFPEISACQRTRKHTPERVNV